MSAISIVRSIGSSNNPLISPWNQEENRDCSLKNDSSIGLNSITRNNDVNALRHGHTVARCDTKLGVHLIAPDTCTHHHGFSRDFESLAGFSIGHSCADDLLAIFNELINFNASSNRCAVATGGANNCHRMARIINLRVVILHGTSNNVLTKRRCNLGNLLT